MHNYSSTCIIDPLYETIYTIDSLRKNNSYITSNILRWYQTELNKHDYDINVSTWNIINSSNLPSSVPRQRDGSSCGIFVAMTAYYWYKYRRLHDKNTDWNENNVNSLTPNLGHFLLHHIIHTVYLENARILNQISLLHFPVLHFPVLPNAMLYRMQGYKCNRLEYPLCILLNRQLF
jgi:Ulp1 family protease